MSWSSDGRYLATSNGENVSVWRLPAKDLKHSNKNMDARVTMPEEEETKKVGRSVEGVGIFIDCRSNGFFGIDCVAYEGNCF